jgi:predicted protein tyrosine phosphatase
MLVYFNFVATVDEPVAADILVDAELVKLTKRVPRTKAEKEFHVWLKQWKATLPKS